MKLLEPSVLSPPPSQADKRRLPRTGSSKALNTRIDTTGLSPRASAITSVVTANFVHQDFHRLGGARDGDLCLDRIELNRRVPFVIGLAACARHVAVPGA